MTFYSMFLCLLLFVSTYSASQKLVSNFKVLNTLSKVYPHFHGAYVLIF